MTQDLMSKYDLVANEFNDSSLMKDGVECPYIDMQFHHVLSESHPNWLTQIIDSLDLFWTGVFNPVCIVV